MTNESGADAHFQENAVEAAVRIVALLLLGAWCFQIFRPFISPMVWGIIIAVAIYPGHQGLARALGGRGGLSATLLTLAMLLLLVWPTIILSGVVIDNAQALTERLQAGHFDMGK